MMTKRISLSDLELNAMINHATTHEQEAPKQHTGNIIQNYLPIGGAVAACIAIVTIVSVNFDGAPQVTPLTLEEEEQFRTTVDYLYLDDLEL